MQARNPSLYEKSPAQRKAYLDLVSLDLMKYPNEKKAVLEKIIDYAETKLIANRFIDSISSTMVRRYELVDKILRIRNQPTLCFLKNTIDSLNTLREEQSSLRDDMLPCAQAGLDSLVQKDEKRLVISATIVMAMSLLMNRHDIALAALFTVFLNDGLVDLRLNYAAKSANETDEDRSAEPYGDSFDAISSFCHSKFTLFKERVSKQLSGPATGLPGLRHSQ